MSSLASILYELRKLGVKCPKEKTLCTFSKQQERVTIHARDKLFGLHLTDHKVASDSDSNLPMFLASITTHLRTHAQNVGLFRKAGSVSRQKELRLKLESGGSLDGAEPNDVATLLKQWLRELPEPVIPHCLHDVFAKCQNLQDESRGHAILLACLLLPSIHLGTLKHLLSFLAGIASNSNANKMDAHNLAIVMAPCIFVLGSKALDKNSNNLVLLHTPVMEFLIENAGKVGAIPPGITLQQKGGNLDLDSSGEALDCSPCRSKRRRKSGGVQDLFSGIRKLRRGPNAFSKTPEGSLDAPRVAQKHKADSDDVSPSNKKRAFASEAECLLNTTPINKDNRSHLLSLNGGTSSSRSRRRSFGLLRKKRSKNHAKSTVFHTKESPAIEQLVQSNLALQKPQAPPPAEPAKPPDSAQQPCSRPVTRSESIKKSSSESLLRPPPPRPELESALSSSVSQGRLEKVRRNSPMQKISATDGPGSLFWEIQNTLENIKKGRIQEILDATFLHGTSGKSGQEDSVAKSRNKSMDKGPVPAESTNDLKKTEMRASQRRRKARACAKSSKNEENQVDTRPLLDDNSILDSPDLNISQRKGIRRQEGFVMKSIRNKHKIPASHDSLIQETTPKTITSKPVKNGEREPKANPDSSKLEVTERKVARRTTRKGSIIRGRPNSIKSGLNLDVYQRFNTPSKILERVDQESKDNLDSSLKTEFDNLSIKSSANGDIIDKAFGIDESISFMDSTPMNFERSKVLNDSQVNDIDNIKPAKLSRTSSSSDSKIPILRHSLEAKKSFSFSGSVGINSNLTPSITGNTKKRVSFQNSSSPGTPGSGSKIPVRTPEGSARISQQSNTPDLFKTPLTSQKLSPTWTPASQYFDSPFESEKESSTKRESIAMILKRKPGHVQAKVSLYDKISKSKVYGTKSLSSATSTPVISSERMLRSQSQRDSSTSRRDSVAVSSSKSSGGKSRSRMKSANLSIPPPPKFVIATPSPQYEIGGSEYSSSKSAMIAEKSTKEENTPGNRSLKIANGAIGTPSPKMPLKEVTNINSSVEVSPFLKTPGRKSTDNRSSMAEENQSRGHSSADLKRRTKRKTNSFSGHTARRISKKVLRSESSPMIKRSQLTLHKPKNLLNPFEFVNMEDSLSPIGNENVHQPAFEAENSLTLLRFNYL